MLVTSVSIVTASACRLSLELTEGIMPGLKRSESTGFGRYIFFIPLFAETY